MRFFAVLKKSHIAHSTDFSVGIQISRCGFH
jgi:hypothetical protein